MKIIGTSRYQYLVEMGSDELTQLTGESTYGGSDPDLRKIGLELEIRKSWGTIRALQVGQRDLPHIANKLRALADLLQPIAVEIPIVAEESRP